MRVTVTGSLSYDYIMDFDGKFADRIMPDKIHKISLSLLVESMNKQLGGTAGNIAFSLKLLGVEPVLISIAGNDFDQYNQFLVEHGISTKKVKLEKKLATSSYFVLTDKDDNQIGSFYLGATKRAASTSLAGVHSTDLVILAPTEPKAMVKYVQECRKNKLPYVYDPAFQIGVFSAEKLNDGVSHAHVLIGNDYEISLIEKKIGVSHNELRSRVPILITTLGGEGSCVETKNEKYLIQPAKPKAVVDPTGAGDAYRSGFVAGYLRGFDLLTCGQMGSVASAYTVEKYGTITHIYTKTQFAERYYKNYKKRLAL